MKKITGLNKAWKEAKEWANANYENRLSIAMDKTTGECYARYTTQNSWFEYDPDIVDLIRLIDPEEEITLAELRKAAKRVMEEA